MLFFKSAIALAVAGSALGAVVNTGFVQTDISFDRAAAKKDRDVTSKLLLALAAILTRLVGTWTKYLATGNATGACGVPYTDKSHGACVQSVSSCGEKIYAYLGMFCILFVFYQLSKHRKGNGTAPKYQTHVTVVDTCSELGPTGLYVTLDAFEELGGTVAAGEIHNVNWKVLKN